MKQAGWILVYWLAGIGFWLPSIVAHAIEGCSTRLGPFRWVALLILPVLAADRILGNLARRRQGYSTRSSISLWMLLGIWMLGPLCIGVSASFCGGGFMLPEGLQMVLRTTLAFPMATFAMSTYDGTLGALIMITVWLPYVAVKSLRGAEPPRLLPFTKNGV